MSGSDGADLVGTDDASFEQFVAAASGRLFTMALLLTGYQRAEAEDLLQDVLERVYRRWRRIIRKGVPEPYVRRMLVNAAVDRWRRVQYRREERLVIGGTDIAGRDEPGQVADRDLLLRALAGLPPRQRAVLVLRYFEDLSEAQSAEVLGCSVGTVKSQASRALAKLRAITPPPSAGDPGQQGTKPGSKCQEGAQGHG